VPGAVETLKRAVDMFEIHRAGVTASAGRICVTPRASLGFHTAYFDQSYTFGIKLTSYWDTADMPRDLTVSASNLPPGEGPRQAQSAPSKPFRRLRPAELLEVLDDRVGRRRDRRWRA
jgi:hypothetical protein